MAVQVSKSEQQKLKPSDFHKGLYENKKRIQSKISERLNSSEYDEIIGVLKQKV
jgi:hypothetical protein